MAELGRIAGVLRDAAGFGLFFTGVLLEAAGRAVSDAVGQFDAEAAELEHKSADVGMSDAPSEAEALGPVAVTRSPIAEQMLREGHRPLPYPTPRDVLERPKPLAGSAAARFARGA